MNTISTEIPPGNHNWVRRDSIQLGTTIWICECGIRTVYMDGSRGWIWTDYFKTRYAFKVPASCTEYKMMKALE